MDLDGPRESESMSMDIDDGAVSCRHPHHCDSTKTNSPGPSGGRMPVDFHARKHQTVGSVQTSIRSLPSHPPPGRERLPGSDSSSQLMITSSSSSSSVNHLGQMGDIYQNHGLARQHRDILPSLKPSVGEVTPRKRKHAQGSPHTHIMDHDHTQDDAFTDGANSQSPRRIRPRLRKRPQDREFTPLLFMSPGQERDPPVEEETILAFHYPSNATDPSRSIQFRSYPGNPREHDTRILQNSSLPKVNDLEDREERGRSDSANSFAEVALASTATPKSSRLSTLQDFWLPRPFEDTEQLSMGSIKVHERGLEVGPSFLLTNSGRTGGREPADSPTDTLEHHIRAPIREHGIHARSPRSAMLPLEPSSTNFFDKPRCDSPDPIDPNEDGLTHFELYPRSR